LVADSDSGRRHGKGKSVPPRVVWILLANVRCGSGEETLGPWLEPVIEARDLQIEFAKTVPVTSRRVSRERARVTLDHVLVSHLPSRGLDARHETCDRVEVDADRLASPAHGLHESGPRPAERVEHRPIRPEAVKRKGGQLRDESRWIWVDVTDPSGRGWKIPIRAEEQVDVGARNGALRVAPFDQRLVQARLHVNVCFLLKDRCWLWWSRIPSVRAIARIE
jgi:hypothetical protein